MHPLAMEAITILNHGIDQKIVAANTAASTKTSTEIRLYCILNRGNVKPPCVSMTIGTQDWYLWST